MIRLISFAFLCFLVTAFLVINETTHRPLSPFEKEDREKMWTEVQESLDKGLPQTAIGKLKEIYQGAVQDEAWAESAKALCQRLIVEGQIDQPVYPNAIRKLEAALPESPDSLQPVLKTILAEWYYVYFSQNRWRFQQRSQTETAPGDDFETWDLARLLNKIDEQFTAALENSDYLKTVPIADYDQLLEKGNVSDQHRPTLFDFLAFEALNFYSLDEQFIRQQGAFEIAADSPAFANADGFLEWDVKSDDGDSFLLKAIRLYQDLMRFHQDDDDRTAWLDADLNRLSFARAVANGDESAERYRAALKRFAEQHADHPASSKASAMLASSVKASGDFVQAMEIAEAGKARFPDSVGGRQCHNIIQDILAKSVQLNSERVWNQSSGSVSVSYRNTEKIWFRLIEFDYRNWPKWGEFRSPQGIYGDLQQQLIRRRPVMEWSADLPETGDYQTRVESIPVELDVKSGCYLLICSTRESFDFSTTDFHQVSMAEIWVSNLGVVVRRSTGDSQMQAQVFDATSGEPVAGATVRWATWKYDGRNSREESATEARTGEDGLATFSQTGNLTKLDVTFQDQKFGLIDNIYASRIRQARTQVNTVFFTDRAIYRPGQLIQFKGICCTYNQSTNDYQTLPGRSVTVTLYDANNQEVEKRDFRSNEFGSFSGSFTAPRDRVTGRMRLQASGVGGATAIRVEEYKRPKFFVEINKPEDAFRLGELVQLSGTATAYTGAAIDSSSVTWRVVRTTHYPAWYRSRYWYMPFNDNRQEIANGETTTDVNGKFGIEFPAEPDRSVSREDEPVFTYEVYADVTDTAGETRSARQTTRIGYTSLTASLAIGEWLTSQDPVEFTLDVTTLDGEGQESSGTMNIHRLTPPDKVHRQRLSGAYRWQKPTTDDPDLSDIRSWPAGDSIHQEDLATDQSGKVKSSVVLDAGAYKAIFATRDSAGQKVVAEVPFIVHDMESNLFPVRIPNYFRARSSRVEPGDEFVAVWGTGYESGRAYIELEHRNKVIRSWWTDADDTQLVLRFPIEEAFRGGIQLRITYVRENRFYFTNQRIDVPWTNKDLTIKWEHFVSNLQPGGRETWTAVVKGPDAQNTVAEMVAGLYDASLDAFTAHNWMSRFHYFFQNHSNVYLQFYNNDQYFNTIHQFQNYNHKDASVIYRHFGQWVGLYYGSMDYFWAEGKSGALGGGRVLRSRSRLAGGVETNTAMEEMSLSSADMDAPAAKAAPASGEAGNEAPAEFDDPSDGGQLDLSDVAPRKNLQETAFFFPHLQVDDEGAVRIEFEIPEALTRWKFMGFAHDNELKAGLLTDEMTTSKDLMVQPNPPRFLREGDLLEFAVKVSNQSSDTQTGKVRLTFADARTGNPVDDEFGNQQLDQNFEIPAGESRSLYWKIQVPDFVGALTYKAVGGSATVSDGEEGFLPVLSKRILVTESLPLPIRGNETKSFDFERLKLAGESDTLQSQTLTLQMTSNPTWYAVMALPYLMEYPHECSEQVFNRLYANALGQHIVTSDPQIKRIFDQWRGTAALDSPLEKNEDLRNVMIAETPWLLDAKQESQARRDVGILFETNRLNSELRAALTKLSQMQHSDGSWPWFPGGRANDYITLYVTTGFGRLRHLITDIDVSSAIKAVDRLDWWIDQQYQSLKRNGALDRNNLSPSICMYFYGRSFFIKDKPVADAYKIAFDYFQSQAREHWPKLGSRQSQGHLAIGLKRLGDQSTPAEIMKSLTERSLQDDELGMFWREGERSWWWYQAPIETQALMIEAYDEVAGDQEKVEELKIWLLKQKQTQNWKTTKATADACYGLLLRGTDLLASDQLVQVKLGGVEIQPEDVEAGTGFYEQRFVRGEIKPEMGQIEMVKSDDGIAWGSIHWQYLEDVGKIEPYEGTPLTLKKGLYIKQNTEKGPVVTEVDGPVQVGDELVMRVELRVDRAMEYVHLKDYRGSGTEPVNVLSRYRFQDGLAYYESTRDTASHFFIDYLPRGTYVFEYSVRVQHRGVYETGIAELQCMYAPEFNSHSGSVQITVE